MHDVYLPIFFRVPSLALGQSYARPIAREVTLKEMGKISRYQITTKQNKMQIVCMFVVVYCNQNGYMNALPLVMLLCLLKKTTMKWNYTLYVRGLVLDLWTLKWKCYFDEVFFIGCTGGSHFDNFQCSKWWKFCEIDISVQCMCIVHPGKYAYCLCFVAI